MSDELRFIKVKLQAKWSLDNLITLLTDKKKSEKDNNKEKELNEAISSITEIRNRIIDLEVTNNDI